MHSLVNAIIDNQTKNDILDFVPWAFMLIILIVLFGTVVKHIREA